MDKINATILNVIMVIIATYMFIIGHFIENDLARGFATGLGIVIIAFISWKLIKSSNLNERRYYIFGTQKKDIIVSAVEFILVFGLMGFLGWTGRVSQQVSAWETILLIAFCMMLFYGVEKKRLRNDMIEEMEEEWRKEQEEAENSSEEDSEEE